MTIVSTQLVDDGFKVINKVTGARNENEKLIELDNLKGSTNESEISIANAYYEVEGTGTVTLQFDDKSLTPRDERAMRREAHNEGWWGGKNKRKRNNPRLIPKIDLIFCFRSSLKGYFLFNESNMVFPGLKFHFLPMA